jgi:hypothetical protein
MNVARRDLGESGSGSEKGKSSGRGRGSGVMMSGRKR